MLAEEARSGCPTGGWIEFVISLQTRSDILQGQALFKGVKQLLTWLKVSGNHKGNSN